jgi:hypothetical protein
MSDLQFPKATPSTRDMLDRVKQDSARELNCHLVCRVESFDKDKNTITASAATKRKYSDGSEVDFPLFVDVPALTLSGGGAFLSFPIKAGDWCLLLFNDRDIDSWWYSGEVKAPNTPRYHSLSDGIAFVGVRPASDPFALTDDAVTLDAGAELVRIKNENQNLKLLMDDLIDLVGQIIQSGNAQAPNGAVVWSAPLPSEFATLKSNFGQLLKE